LVLNTFRIAILDIAIGFCVKIQLRNFSIAIRVGGARSLLIRPKRAAVVLNAVARVSRHAGEFCSVVTNELEKWPDAGLILKSQMMMMMVMVMMVIEIWRWDTEEAREGQQRRLYSH
jgi:hypothetical protein